MATDISLDLPIFSNPLDQPTTTTLRCSTRDQTTSIKLWDYDCNTVKYSHIKSHSSAAPPSSTVVPSKSLYSLTHYIASGKLSYRYRYFLASVTEHTEPTKFSDAISSSKWHPAMQQGPDAIEFNGT